MAPSDHPSLHLAIVKPNMIIKTDLLSIFWNYLALICKAEILYLTSLSLIVLFLYKSSCIKNHMFIDVYCYLLISTFPPLFSNLHLRNAIGINLKMINRLFYFADICMHILSRQWLGLTHFQGLYIVVQLSIYPPKGNSVTIFQILTHWKPYTVSI